MVRGNGLSNRTDENASAVLRESFCFPIESLELILEVRSLKAAILVLGMEKGITRCFSLCEHSWKFKELTIEILVCKLV